LRYTHTNTHKSQAYGQRSFHARTRGKNGRGTSANSGNEGKVPVEGEAGAGGQPV